MHLCFLQEFHCAATSHCDSMSFRWRLDIPTNPPVHKLVIERRSILPGSVWVEIHEEEVTDSKQIEYLVMTSLLPGDYSYRIAAWSTYGRSDKVEAAECEAAIGQKCPMLPDSIESINRVGKPSAGLETGPVDKDDSSLDNSAWAGRLAGFTTFMVLVATVALRCLQARHISLMRCMAFCGLNRFVGSFHFMGWQSIAESKSDILSSDRDRLTRSDIALASVLANEFSGSRVFSSGGSQASRQSAQRHSSVNDGSSGYSGHAVWKEEVMNSTSSSFSTANWGSWNEADGSSYEDLGSQEIGDINFSEIALRKCSFEG